MNILLPTQYFYNTTRALLLLGGVALVALGFLFIQGGPSTHITAAASILGLRAPTATLTLNGSTNITVNVGDTLNYAWSSTNAASAKLLFTQDSASCGLSGTGPFDYQIDPKQTTGTYSEPVTDCWAGHSYVVTFEVKDTRGRVAQASATVTVRPSTTPSESPTASFTINGDTNVSVKVGDTLNYAWSSTNAVTASQSYTQDRSSCGVSGTGPVNLGAVALNGTYSETVTDCWAGHTYVLTFSATNATGETANASVTVQVAPVARPAVSLDGAGCPMAHCNLNDTSFSGLSPLMSISQTQAITDSRVSPIASQYLGCTSGQSRSVCVYDSPDHPAVVAFNISDGSVAWTSAVGDFPVTNNTRGVNMALQIQVSGQSYTIASNPTDIIAYTSNGGILWKKKISTLWPEAGSGIGAPLAPTVESGNTIVVVTTTGWIIKLDPLTGSVVDAYQMNTTVYLNGVAYQGTLITTNASAIQGDVLYAVTEFRPGASTPLPQGQQPPVYLVRIKLNQPGVAGNEFKITPLAAVTSATSVTPDRLAIGFKQAGASPAIVPHTDGSVSIFTNAYVTVRSQTLPSIIGAKDRGGVLSLMWRSTLPTAANQVYSAAGLDPVSQTLFVPTLQGIYVYRNAGTLSGTITPPTPLSVASMLTCGSTLGATSVLMGSPFGLGYNSATGEIVVYTNFVFTSSGAQYSYLGAFAMPRTGSPTARPLWCRSLNPENGNDGTGWGTFGQPALFQYQKPDGSTATGIIVNTVSTGTHIFK